MRVDGVRRMPPLLHPYDGIHGSSRVPSMMNVACHATPHRWHPERPPTKPRPLPASKPAAATDLAVSAAAPAAAPVPAPTPAAAPASVPVPAAERGGSGDATTRRTSRMTWELMGRELAARQENTRLRAVVAGQARTLRALELRALTRPARPAGEAVGAARARRLRDGLGRAVAEVCVLRRTVSALRERCARLERGRDRSLLLEGIGKLWRLVVARRWPRLSDYEARELAGEFARS